jgi:hypothetical protein
LTVKQIARPVAKPVKAKKDGSEKKAPAVRKRNLEMRLQPHNEEIFPVRCGQTDRYRNKVDKTLLVSSTRAGGHSSSPAPFAGSSAASIFESRFMLPAWIFAIRCLTVVPFETF